MEVNFSELKQKDVINLVDGKHLGRVCNISFTFPESKILGFTVTGCKGFKFSRQEIFLPIKTVVKIGEDAVLVNLCKEEKDCPPPKKAPNKRECPPQYNPPPCPPKNSPPDCPPYYSDNYSQNRRSLDEYE